jgi:GNAT superfamily N-acetyltransferase
VITVLPAGPEHAAAACDVVRRSIAGLCAADHRHDPETLAAWLANKTPDRFERMIGDPERHCVVALESDAVRGFGALSREGEVRVLYVDPGTAGRGAGSLMLRRLEEQAAAWGATEVFLNSSLTARGFYAARGYEPAGDPRPGFGVTRMWPMKKRLTAPPIP